MEHHVLASLREKSQKAKPQLRQALSRLQRPSSIACIAAAVIRARAPSTPAAATASLADPDGVAQLDAPAPRGSIQLVGSGGVCMPVVVGVQQRM